jgi:hypothetical protein
MTRDASAGGSEQQRERSVDTKRGTKILKQKIKALLLLLLLLLLTSSIILQNARDC